MHPDTYLALAQQRSQDFLREAESYRQAQGRRRHRRLHLPAWPWQEWQLRSPLVRRPCIGERSWL